MSGERKDLHPFSQPSVHPSCLNGHYRTHTFHSHTPKLTHPHTHGENMNTCAEGGPETYEQKYETKYWGYGLVAHSWIWQLQIQQGVDNSRKIKGVCFFFFIQMLQGWQLHSRYQTMKRRKQWVLAHWFWPPTVAVNEHRIQILAPWSICKVQAHCTLCMF